MEHGANSSAPSTAQIVVAWAVHLYTASGVVVGFLALLAALRGDYRECFLLLALALAIDASDGTLARKACVKQVIPWVDGEILDNIVDYFTYVIVPTAVFVQPGILPEGCDWAAFSVLLASAYGFSRTDAKGFVEHYFQGFPSYWNIVAFYFVALKTNPTVNLIILLTLAVAVFLPMRWLYPSRMEKARTPMLIGGVVWATLSLYIVATMPDHSVGLAWLSMLYPAYYTAGSVAYHFSER
jgi:phosphatidylcholine synthase